MTGRRIEKLGKLLNGLALIALISMLLDLYVFSERRPTVTKIPTQPRQSDADVPVRAPRNAEHFKVIPLVGSSIHYSRATSDSTVHTPLPTPPPPLSSLIRITASAPVIDDSDTERATVFIERLSNRSRDVAWAGQGIDLGVQHEGQALTARIVRISTNAVEIEYEGTVHSLPLQAE